MDPLTILSALATLQASADGAHRILLTLGSFATSIMKAEQSRRKVLEEAQSFRVVLAAVQTQLSAVTRRQDMGAINHHLPALLPLRSSLENCDKISYDLVYQLESSHKSWHSRLLWPEKEKELQRCLTTLQRFKGDMSLLLQAMTLDRVLSVHDLVTQGEDTARDSRQSKVLEWLQCIDCSEEHASVRRRRKQSTCTWLFRDECFTRWYESRGGGLLWMYGKPGVGKTVITSAVIDELQERNCTLAYFYCDYQKARDVQVTDILRSLVAQFFRQSDKNWLSSFPDVLKLQSRGFPLPSDHAILLEWLLKSARLHEQPVIVLDALDECEDVCGRELLKIISRMNTGHLSLFLASRDEPRIRKAYEEILTGAFFFSTTVSLEERWQTRRDDLHTLVVQELGSRRSLGCLPDEVRTDMLERLLEKSGGMFRWVQCQLDRLEKCIGTREIKQVLDTLPEGLNETYCRILSVINERPFCKRVVLRVLSWLIVSLRPLHIQAVMEAVKIEIGEFTIDDEMGVIDEDCLLEACSSLVSLDEKTRMLSLSHFSVKEYLTDEQTFHSELQEFHISPATAHRQLALSSITYTLVSDVYHRLPSLPECQRLLSYCITNGLQHVRYTSSDDGQLLYYLDVFQQHVIENPQKLDKLKMLARTLSNDFFNTLLDAPNCVSSIVLQFGSPWLVNRYLDLRPNVINGTGVGNPLKYAIQGGRLDVVQELLVRGQDPKQPSASYWGGSVTFEDFDPISFALSEKRQLTLPFVENLCSLMQIIRGDIIHHICCHDHWSLSLIQILLERGADAAYLDEQGQSALHKCIRACDREDTCLEIALLLVEAGCYVDSQDWEGQSPLHIAVYSGFAAVTRFLLDRGADISYIDKQGDSVLHKCLRSYAFGEVRKELLLLLLEEGASVDIENSEGETPLHLAGSRGFDLAIRVLLDFQATIAHLDKNGRSVLEKYFLTPNGWHEDRFETVWLLVEAGFPIDLRNSAGETLLHLVARSGTASQIRTLMELGADSFALDNWGACALHKCFDRDDQLEVLNIVEVLAEGGCPIDAPDPHNETPLHLAARRRFFSVVEFLLGKGADCTSLDEDGASALHKCLYSQGFGETVEIVQLLLEAGCSVDVRNSKGEVPMHLAAGQGFPSVIRLLLAWVADVTSVDMAGNSALHWCLTATYRRNEEACLQTARLLVDAGCPPDLPNSLGETPLHLAASSGFDSVIGLILTQGANPASVDNSGDSALHKCLSAPALQEDVCLKIAQSLVRAGCPTCISNSQGKTPLHLASSRGFALVVSFLLDHDSTQMPHDIVLHVKGLACLYLVLEYHANALTTSIAEDTALHTLFHSNWPGHEDALEMARVLVDAGCDVNARNSEGKTPLHYAVLRDVRAVRFLLSAGACLPNDIITTVLSHPKKLVGQQSCFTSLLIHFDNPLFDMLSTLVQHARTLGQSGVFACDEGQTPLHRLLRLGKREYLTSRQTQDVVRMLVECGCDHLLPDGVGLTPIELASERGHEKIVNYLLNHGAKLPGTTHVRA